MEMKREARRAKGGRVIGDEEDRRREIRGAEARGRENIDGEHEATQPSSTIFAVNLLPFVTNLFPSKRSVHVAHDDELRRILQLIGLEDAKRRPQKTGENRADFCCFFWGR